MTAVGILQALIEATPPPLAGQDPSVLIEVAMRICRAREPLVAELRHRAGVAPVVEDLTALIGQLAELDGRWQAALAVARDALHGRARALRRLRASAR